ncbi:MAG: hypothetical protein GY757_36965 [bacterium]|nr:hypothetical protein [bacterium]
MNKKGLNIRSGLYYFAMGCFFLTFFSFQSVAQFNTSNDAKKHIETTFPALKGTSLWKKAMREDQRFKNYVVDLKKNKPQEFYRFMNQIWETHDYFPGQQNMTRIPTSATQDYYCHDFAWRKGNRRKKKVDPALDKLPTTHGNHVDPDKIMANPGQWGFTYLGTSYRKLRAADVVVYLHENETAAHSALVIRLNPKGVRSGEDVYMMSKDGPNAIFRHRLGKQGKPNFFRDYFAPGGFRFYRRK